VATELCIPIAEGVYAAMLGPSYETPAEIRYLRTIGAGGEGREPRRIWAAATSAACCGVY